MSTIQCQTIDDTFREVPIEYLSFRPGAYAIIEDRGSILLINPGLTGKYLFPGGGVEQGERLEEALVREVLEETGLIVVVDHFLFFVEKFFYHELAKRAVHSFLFFYKCSVVGGSLLETHLNATSDDTEEPCFVVLENLTPEQFAPYAREAFVRFRSS